MITINKSEIQSEEISEWATHYHVSVDVRGTTINASHYGMKDQTPEPSVFEKIINDNIARNYLYVDLECGQFLGQLSKFPDSDNWLCSVKIPGRGIASATVTSEARPTAEDFIEKLNTLIAGAQNGNG